jgi:hypothetical protein
MTNRGRSEDDIKMDFGESDCGNVNFGQDS